MVIALLLALVIVPLLVLLKWFSGDANGYAWGVCAGIPSGLLILVIAYYLQRPSFEIEPVKGTYIPAARAHWVHLSVENKSIGFMGGGTAANCVGEIRLDNGDTFKPKWETRLNPFKLDIVSVPVTTPGSTSPTVQLQFVQSVDPSMVEQASVETLRRGDKKNIDIAVRFADEEDCYIHEPENFLTLKPQWRPTRTKVGTGIIPFDFRLKWDTGDSPWERFQIVNTNGGDPSQLYVRRPPA